MMEKKLVHQTSRVNTLAIVENFRLAKVGAYEKTGTFFKGLMMK